MTHSKTLTGMQQNVYIANLVEAMEHGKEYSSKQMAELLRITPWLMKSLIHKMGAHGIIVKIGRAQPSLWKLNSLKMPRCVNRLI